MTEFKLQFPESELQSNADEWGQDSTETDAFQAGEAIRNGDRSIESLQKILHWKSPRSVHYLNDSEDQKVIRCNALDLATKANSDDEAKDALSALMKLDGVALPVASAILTVINPERYTIIDFRALEALGHPRQDEEFYIAYLKCCRNLADAMKPQQNLPAPTKLRALDRALWQWSKKKDSKG
jgi:hypothetical protein